MTEPADALDHVFQTGDDDAAALEVFGGARFTRTQLQDEVLRCAAWLAAEGVGSGTRVICDAGRSAEHVIALLGCWWLGAVFVPLERDLLELRRQAFMARLDHAFDPRLWSRTDWATHAPIDRPRVTLQPESPAYIAFTSGSTGTPKGAVIPHGGLAPLASTQVAAFRVAPGHRTSWGLAAHFDASFSDILVPLFAGATLVVLPEDGPSLLTALEAAALTHVDLPPSLLAAAVARGLPSGLETIVCGGEPAPRAALRAAARDVHMVNVYGPTETTVCASVEVVAADGSDSTYDSIGTPLPGVVFDVDESGELLIGGWGVALGYLEDTADGAFTGEGEARRYRTGDLVQALPDGSFAFLGRIDRQVQIRGKRIEPEEIERALGQHPAVEEAVVLARGGHEPVLVAVAVTRADGAALRAWLLERLEPWKVPLRIETAADLPRLGNQKVDRAGTWGHYIDAPDRTQTGRDPLTRAWAAVFGDAKRGDDENFVNRGGDSVRALELCVEAARHGIGIEPESIERIPRLGDLRSAASDGLGVHDLRGRAAACLAKVPPVTQHQGQGARVPARMLVTGATGLFGPWLIHALAERGAEVIALVRAADDPSAELRLREAMGGALPAGVRAVAGDVTQHALGLGEGLPGLTSVVHAAGSVDVVRGYGGLERVNVGGTVHAAAFAARAGARFDFISTLSVFAESAIEQTFIPDGLELDAAERVFGGYAQTKWVADAVAAGSELPGATIRLGLLVGAERSGTQPRDQLSRTVRGLRTLGTWPAGLGTGAFDVTPVRVAAEVTAQLVLADTNGRLHAHIARSEPASASALRAALEAEGVTLRNADSWPPEHGNDAGADVAVALAALAPLGRPRAGNLMLCTNMRFQTDTADALAEGGLSAPVTAAELRALVRLALG